MYRVFVEKMHKDDQMAFRFARWSDVTEFALAVVEAAVDPVKVTFWEEEEC